MALQAVEVEYDIGVTDGVEEQRLQVKFDKKKKSLLIDVLSYQHIQRTYNKTQPTDGHTIHSSSGGAHDLPLASQLPHTMTNSIQDDTTLTSQGEPYHHRSQHTATVQQKNRQQQQQHPPHWYNVS